MTVWFWVLTAVAVLWPVVLINLVEKHTMQNVEKLFKMEAEREAWELANSVDLKVSVERLQKVIEEQDALIVVLWLKVFGIGFREDYGRGELQSHWSKKPSWYLDAMEFPGVYDTLRRAQKYPWGNSAECVQRD